jgi:hypothetical protein
MSISIDDALTNKKNGRAAAPSETLGTLGIAQHRVAKLFGVGPRSVRRWQCGDRRVPCGVDIVLRLLAAGTVTLAQVEQAAVPIPVRSSSFRVGNTAVVLSESQTGEISPPAVPEINETAEPEPAESETPEQSAWAPAETATSAAPAVGAARKEIAADAQVDAQVDGRAGLTTVEKVLALAPGACRWPYGDPDHPDFRFCCDPAVEKQPYCKHHCARAYMAAPPRPLSKTLHRMLAQTPLGSWRCGRNARAIGASRTTAMSVSRDRVRSPMCPHITHRQAP